MSTDIQRSGSPSSPARPSSVPEQQAPQSPYKSRLEVPSKPPPIPSRLSVETSKLIAFVAESVRAGGQGLLSSSRIRNECIRPESARLSRVPALTLEDMGWKGQVLKGDKKSKKRLRRPQSARTKTPRQTKMANSFPLAALSPGKTRTKVDVLHMEQGWNPNIPVTERRIADFNSLTPRELSRLKGFETAKLKQSPLASPSKVSAQKSPERVPAPESIHIKPLEGSDPRLELDVLKKILIREGLLNRLNDHARRMLGGEEVVLRNAEGSGLLDLLVQVRAASVEVVEAVVSWRKKLPTPTGFLYNGRNYLLKMKSDMDFLSTVLPLVEALGVQPSAMVSNPFMMPRNLDERRAELEREEADAKRTEAMNQGNEKEDESVARRGGEEGPRDDQQRIAEAEKVVMLEFKVYAKEGQPGVPATNGFSHVRAGVKLNPLNPGEDGKPPPFPYPSSSLDTPSSARHGRLPTLDITPRQKGSAKEALLSSPLIPKADRRKRKAKEQRESKISAQKPPKSNQKSEKKAQSSPLRKQLDVLYQKAIQENENLQDGNKNEHEIRSRTSDVALRDGNMKKREGSAKKRLVPQRRPPGSAKALSEGTLKEMESEADITAAEKLTLEEIKSLSLLQQPPQIIALVCATTIILLSPAEAVPDSSWGAVQRAMNDEEAFLSRLRSFDALNIPSFKVRALIPFLSNPQFRPTQLLSLSSAASKLCAWVLAVLKNEEYRLWLSGAKEEDKGREQSANGKAPGTAMAGKRSTTPSGQRGASPSRTPPLPSSSLHKGRPSSARPESRTRGGANAGNVKLAAAAGPATKSSNSRASSRGRANSKEEEHGLDKGKPAVQRPSSRKEATKAHLPPSASNAKSRQGKPKDVNSSQKGITRDIKSHGKEGGPGSKKKEEPATSSSPDPARSGLSDLARAEIRSQAEVLVQAAVQCVVTSHGQSLKRESEGEEDRRNEISLAQKNETSEKSVTQPRLLDELKEPVPSPAALSSEVQGLMKSEKRNAGGPVYADDFDRDDRINSSQLATAPSYEERRTEDSHKTGSVEEIAMKNESSEEPPNGLRSPLDAEGIEGYGEDFETGEHLETPSPPPSSSRPSPSTLTIEEQTQARYPTTSIEVEQEDVQVADGTSEQPTELSRDPVTREESRSETVKTPPAQIQTTGRQGEDESKVQGRKDKGNGHVEATSEKLTIHGAVDTMVQSLLASAVSNCSRQQKQSGTMSDPLYQDENDKEQQRRSSSQQVSRTFIEGLMSGAIEKTGLAPVLTRGESQSTGFDETESLVKSLSEISSRLESKLDDEAFRKASTMAVSETEQKEEEDDNLLPPIASIEWEEEEEEEDETERGPQLSGAEVEQSILRVLSRMDMGPSHREAAGSTMTVKEEDGRTEGQPEATMSTSTSLPASTNMEVPTNPEETGATTFSSAQQPSIEPFPASDEMGKTPTPPTEDTAPEIRSPEGENEGYEEDFE